jgi:hypothetical protein
VAESNVLIPVAAATVAVKITRVGGAAD